MNLLQLKQHFEGFDQGFVFNFKLSEPFSWRGSYDEVAFTLLKEDSTIEENLSMISKALTEEFIGYKGGSYLYSPYTQVNFEGRNSGYTDGSYTQEKIIEITGSKYIDPENTLIKLAFK